MRFVVRTLAACFLVAVTAGHVHAKMPDGVALAFMAGYALVMLSLLLMPFVALIVLAVCSFEKKSPPSSRRRDKRPDPENRP
jgi:hypothetical protein